MPYKRQSAKKLLKKNNTRNNRKSSRRKRKVGGANEVKEKNWINDPDMFNFFFTLLQYEKYGANRFKYIARIIIHFKDVIQEYSDEKFNEKYDTLQFYSEDLVEDALPYFRITKKKNGNEKQEKPKKQDAEKELKHLLTTAKTQDHNGKIKNRVKAFIKNKEIKEIVDKFVENEAEFKTKQTEQAQKEFVKKIELVENRDNSDLLLQVFKLSATSSTHVKGEKALKAMFKAVNHTGKLRDPNNASSDKTGNLQMDLSDLNNASSDNTGNLKKTFSLGDPNNTSPVETTI